MGGVYDVNLHELTWDSLKTEKDYFVKDNEGECGSFVKHIKDYQKLMEYKDKLKTGEFILQRRVFQDEEMNKINPNAINTLRLVSICNQKGTYYFSGLLRVGTSKTENLYNWSRGGLAIGVKKNGYLQKYGFQRREYGGKQSEHPDTHFQFKKFKVPYFKEAVDLAVKAHRYFYRINSIGWDIAITPNGHGFIEGNDNWEISLMQAGEGHGLRKEWKDTDW